MNKNLLFSIIIPVFNRKEILKKTLQTVLDQTYTNWELILVDDGSEDGSKELQDSYAKGNGRIKAFSRPSSRLKGANACRNFGYEKSSGSYVIWLDSDDLLRPNFLETAANQLEESPAELTIVGCHAEIGGKIESYGVLDPNMGLPLYKEYLLGNLKVITANCIWHSGFLKGKKLFDEEVMKMQEVECYHRLFMHVKQHQFIKEVLCDYVYKSPGSITLNGSISAAYVSSNLSTNRKILNEIFRYDPHELNVKIIDRWSRSFGMYYKNALQHKRWRDAVNHARFLHHLLKRKGINSIRFFLLSAWYFVTGTGRDQLRIE